MIVSIYIDNERLDLFGEESISLVSSVLDIQDISKNTTEFTKVFTVPASNNNNRIFKHYYNANIDNTFDARVSVDARIELSGIEFRTGKILLQRVEVKDNIAYAYTINFIGDLLSLKELFGADYLSDVDFSAYNENYTPTWIKERLIDDSTTAELKVPLLATKRYYYNSDVADDTQTETETNIAYTGAATLNGIDYRDLKPAIRVKTVLDTIASHYGLTFESDLFDTAEFNTFFLHLDNGIDNEITTNEETVDFDSKDASNIYTNLTTNITTVSRTVATNGTRFIYTGNPPAVLSSYKLRIYDNDTLVSEVDGLATSITYSVFGIGESNVRVEVVSSNGVVYDGTLIIEIYDVSPTIPILSTNAYNSIQPVVTPTFDVAFNMPKIKVIDFFKGILQAFKMVVIKSGDNVYVDTINNYYSNGSLIDLTPYIDYERVDVKRGEILNTISYEFIKAKTLLAATYEESNRRGYGDEELILKDDAGQLLDGGKKEIKLPFEQIVYERLTDIDTDDLTTIQYGMLMKDTLQKVHPEAHILYLISRDVSANTVGFWGTVKSELDTINVPSHSISDVINGTAFLFSAEFDEYSGQALTDNLYSIYHQTYINQLFNVKRRLYDFMAKNIPETVLNSIKLNDVIKIKNNYYRIDKFTTDLIKMDALFELYNIQELDITL